jgi:hypothetical protein
MHALPKVLAVLAAVASAAAGACQRYPYDPTKATRPYPAQLGQGSLVDIQVIPDIGNGNIKLVNATGTTYRDFDLWINQRYVRRVDELGSGRTLELEVESFWDERGEGPFPGGWFRYYQPTPIVLVQIQVAPDKPLVGLVTKPPDADRR